MKKYVWLVAFMCALSVSCSSDDVAQQANGNDRQAVSDSTSAGFGTSLTSEQLSAVKAVNGFALNLFAQQTKRSAGRSTVLSPFSAAVVMGMLHQGATQTTAAEIRAALHLEDNTQSSISEQLHDLAALVASNGEQAQLSMANNLVINSKSSSLKENFREAMKTYYQTEPLWLDFSSSFALESINNWCKAHTDGRITEIISELDKDVMICVLNAVSLSALWQKPFDEAETRGGIFVKADGTHMSIKMMNAVSEVDYLEDGEIQAVRLPMGTGKYAMTLLLPPASTTTDQWIASLSAEKLAGMAFKKEEVMMTIPIFETETEADLKDLLKDMGVRRMFNRYLSELTEIVEMQQYVTLMKQKVRLGIDEKGCEGSAVTIAELKDGSDIGGSQQKRFMATRPFVYMVSDADTGLLLFTGQFGGE